jgi:heme-degrading monooxygenase HmoA
MHNIVTTPPPPYSFVIFTSRRSDGFRENPEYRESYAETLKEMLALAEQNPGFLGCEIATGQEGHITIAVSYWKDHETIEAWRNDLRHKAAKEKAAKFWFSEFVTRTGRVEREDASSTETEADRQARWNSTNELVR